MSCTHGIAKSSCRICKTIWARKKRAKGGTKEKDRAYYERVKGWLMSTSRSAVYIAVRSGKIPKASTFKCKDCDRQAEVYDHRDYAKPLKVQPVCRSCNSKRGPGKNKIAMGIHHA